MKKSILPTAYGWCIYIVTVFNRLDSCRVRVIVVENGCGGSSSSPVQGVLHFTFEKVCI